MRKVFAVWLGLVFLFICATAQAEEPFHFTSADFAQTSDGSFTEPERTLDANVEQLDWQQTNLPSVVARQVVPTKSHFEKHISTTWYRLRNIASIETGSDDPLYLYIPRWQTIGKIAIYANNALVFKSEGGPMWNGYNHPVWINLDTALPNGIPVNDVTIRIDHLTTAGSALSTVWIGPKNSLGIKYSIRSFLQNKFIEIASSAFLLIGFFSLALWFKHRQESIYLLFTLSSVLSYLRCMQYFVGTEPLYIPEVWFTWVNINASGWLTLALYFFCFRLHGRRYPKIERTCVALMGMVSLITLPVLDIFADMGVVISFVNLILFAELIFISGLMIFASWKSQSRDGLTLSLLFILNVPLVIYDILLQNYQINIENIYLLPYTTLGPLFVLIVIVNRRYTTAMVEVADANKMLESRLALREAELNTSYVRLKEIELRQAVTDERQRLVRDMHDGLGSTLVSALTVVERGKLETWQMAEILHECIDDLKLTLDSLESVETDILLMLATLRYRLEPRLAQAGIIMEWRVVEIPKLDWLGPTDALQILRILQEIFTNILKHSEASVIQVSTGFTSSEVSINIKDNGKGFNVEQMTSGRGLLNLKKRTESLKGMIFWDSGEAGTIVRLTLKSSYDESAQTQN